MLKLPMKTLGLRGPALILRRATMVLRRATMVLRRATMILRPATMILHRATLRKNIPQSLQIKVLGVRPLLQRLRPQQMKIRPALRLAISGAFRWS